MFGATYFVQGCPVCGRNLQVRLEYLGRSILCPHCKGQFIAYDPATEPRSITDSGEILDRRVKELLTASAESKPHPK